MGFIRRVFRLSEGPGHVESAVDEELAFHLEQRTQQLIASGLTPDAARAEARRQFGNVPSVRNDCVTLDKEFERATRRAGLVDQLSQDLRYAFRALRRARGMTTVAVITLAVAIGALTTVATNRASGSLPRANREEAQPSRP